MAVYRVSINPYNYVVNNPVNRVDPNGKIDLPVIVITAKRVHKPLSSSFYGWFDVSSKTPLGKALIYSNKFAEGAANAIVANWFWNAPGLRDEPEDEDDGFSDGQTAGDVMSMFFGTGEAIIGLGGEGVGLIGEGPTFGASTVLVVGGAGLIVHGGGFALSGLQNQINKFSKKKSSKSGKEKASDTPSWSKGQKPNPGEKPSDFAKRVLDGKYGPGNWKDGPGSEYNQLKKYAERLK